MKLVPMGEYVVVERVAAEETTAGGILLPEDAREQPLQGRVLSVGSGRITDAGRHIPSQVSEGDRILFSRYAGSEFQLDGQEVLIMRESDILAVLG